MSTGFVRLLICHAVVGVSMATAGTIDVVFDDSRFGTVDSSTGLYTQISNIPLGEAAGIAAGLTSLFVEDIYSNLLSIDPLTGVATLVGNSGLNLTVPVFGGGSNGLFELDTASNLYWISPSTGLATLIGATGLNPNNFQYDTSLSSDGTSLFYTAGPAGGIDELYRIDTKTGKSSDLGSTGVAGVAGSAFANGSLALFQYNRPANYIYSATDAQLNAASAGGASPQFIQGPVLGAQIVDGGAVMSGAAEDASSQNLAATVPEPDVIVLTVSGLALVFGGWGRRQRIKRA